MSFELIHRSLNNISNPKVLVLVGKEERGPKVGKEVARERKARGRGRMRSKVGSVSNCVGYD
jgi:hypothetical protein